MPSKNVDFLYRALTGRRIESVSDGRIQRMTPEQASGLIGSWIVETGRPNLDRLDVVEAGAGQGRGLSQYTGARRTAYDKARAYAISQGRNPDSPQWQLEYFAQEYVGRHDPEPGASLVGWTRVFENKPAKGSPADFARYFTGSAASGRGYFRPSVPHHDRRATEAQRIYDYYKNQPSQPILPTPKPQTPADQPWYTKLGIPNIFGAKSN